MSSCKTLLLWCCRAVSDVLTCIDFALYDSRTVLEKQTIVGDSPVRTVLEKQTIVGDSPVHEII